MTILLIPGSMQRVNLTTQSRRVYDLNCGIAILTCPLLHPQLHRINKFLLCLLHNQRRQQYVGARRFLFVRDTILVPMVHSALHSDDWLAVGALSGRSER